MGTITTVNFKNDTLFAVERDDGIWVRSIMRRVYIVGFADGSVKVGVTRHLKGRIATLCQTRRTLGLTDVVTDLAASPPHINALENEAAILSAFERPHGEYVRAAFGEVAAYASALDFRTKATEIEAARSAKIAEAWGSVTVPQIAPPHAQRPELSTEDKIGLVAEARETFGQKAARELWAFFGLPATGEVSA
jgi:hypothetical protein